MGKNIKKGTMPKKEQITKEQAEKKKASFNPYLLPLMFVLGVLPLIVHLKIYDTHLEDFDFLKLFNMQMFSCITSSFSLSLHAVSCYCLSLHKPDYITARLKGLSCSFH